MIAPVNEVLARHLLRLPNATRVDTNRADVYVVDGFLHPAECAAMAAIVRRGDLSAASGELVREIDDRICRYLGINAGYSETLRGQHYEVGEECKAHTDYFEADELGEVGAVQGQRTWTMMVYLNEPELGGEIRFVNLGATIFPQRGRAVVWNNQYPGGTPNPDTTHHDMPVRAGYKTILTKWFRERGDGPMLMDEPHRNLPVLTRTGFAKTRMPGDLWNTLRDFYRHNAPVPLTGALKEETHVALGPLMRQWAGRPLIPTAVDGIKRYSRHATVTVERDRLETHIASAILHIDQDVDRPWPLEIEDHYCRAHRIVLSPGEMLLYEGGRLPHGRPTPLEGTSYANVFVHYKPR